jgi:glycosyltransferase involved in cell wall biosynthesis
MPAADGARSEARAVSLLSGARLAVRAVAPPMRGGELLLRERSTGREHRVPILPTETGFDAVVPLQCDDGPVLWTGTWDAHVAVGPAVSRLAAREGLQLARPLVLRAGHGARRVRPFTTAKGNFSIDVTSSSLHAELRRVEIGTEAITLVGELPADGSRPERLTMKNRSGQPDVKAPVSVEDNGFRADIELSDLVSSDTETQVWDLHLQMSGLPELLRIGQYFDDIADKKRILVYPWRRTTRDGIDCEIRPYFTIQNNLSVQVRPARRAKSPAATPAPSDAKELGQKRRLPLRARVEEIVTDLVRSAGRRRLAVLRRGPAPMRRRPGAPPRTTIYFLIMHAYGMGGTIRTVLNVAGHLGERHDVEVISMVRKRTEPFFPFPAGVRVTALDDHTGVGHRRGPWARVSGAASEWVRTVLRDTPSELIHPEDYAFPASSLWTDLAVARRLRSLHHGVLITTRPAFNLIAADLVAPAVITVGQEHMNFHAHRSGLASAINADYGKLDALVVLTAEDQQDYSALLTGTGTHVARIPNALPEVPGERSSLRRPLVVAAGRLTPQKGFDLLIPAFAQVARKRPDWMLRIYGAGPKLTRLRRLVFEHHVYNNVFLMGSTEHLGEELSEASVYALSSRYEGFGMVIIEAMSKGVPVVSFDCPRGPSEIISDGVDGLLVGNGDVDGLAEALLRLIEDEDARRRMGEAALQTSARYALSVVGDAWEDLLTDLTAEKPLRSTDRT